MDQPGKVANPARGQLNRENSIPLSPCVPENLVSRDGFSRPVPRQPAHPHTQAECGMYYIGMVITYTQQSRDQPGTVVNPARCQQLERENDLFLCPRMRLRVWSRETGSAVPSRVSLLILHSQAE